MKISAIYLFVEADGVTATGIVLDFHQIPSHHLSKINDSPSEDQS